MLIPIETFDLERLASDKPVLAFKDDAHLGRLPGIFAELLLREIYPLTVGIPFCHGEIQHMVETFHKKKSGNDFPECAGCRLKVYCAYTGKGFTPRPITRVDEDLQKWLDDETIIDWL